MIKVDMCLGQELETGGRLLGKIVLVFSMVAIVWSIVGVIILISSKCQPDVNKIVFDRINNDPRVPQHHKNLLQDVPNPCGSVKKIALVVYVIYIIIFSGSIFFSRLFIQGIENRDYVRLKPMVVFSVVLVLICFASIISLATSGIIIGVVGTILYAYTFIVSYSLFELLKNVPANAQPNVQAQPKV